MKVSIIIPSCNRFAQLKNTIHALEQQSVKNFDALIIDDASEDETPRLTLPANFNMMRNDKSLGLAQTRNIGIRNTDGDLIIFLDAEMLVRPNFVANHIHLQTGRENLALTGSLYYFYIRQSATVVPFSEKFEQSIRRKDYFYKNVIVPYGNDLQNFHIPWIACMTGNLSIKRNLLNQSGWYDPSFVGYGWEDWELGYRLHQCGAIFKVDPSIASIHQEHAVSRLKWQESLKNYAYFRDKHSCMEVNALSLELIKPGFSIKEINEFLHAYKQLENEKQKIILFELIEQNARSLTNTMPKPPSSNRMNQTQLPEGIVKDVYSVLSKLHS